MQNDEETLYRRAFHPDAVTISRIDDGVIDDANWWPPGRAGRKLPRRFVGWVSVSGPPADTGLAPPRRRRLDSLARRMEDNP